MKKEITQEKEGFKEVIDLITNAALELNNGATEEELLAKNQHMILKSTECLSALQKKRAWSIEIN